MIRLMAFDLDDTLLNPQGKISPRTLEALKAAMATGCRVSLSSGRMLESMLPIAEEIGVNAPMLMYNGAMIYNHNTDETIFAPRIKYEIALEIVKLAEELGYYIQTYPGKGYYCDRIREATIAYAKQINVDPIPVNMPMSQWMEQNPSDMQKMLIIDTVEGATRIKDIMTERFPEGAVFLKSKPHFVEIAPPNINKGYSLKKLGEHLGIAREEIMAFGDGQNDVPMLEYAGYGYAMANACKEALACTDLVAPSNAEDGVAQIIESYLKEGKLGG